MLGGREIGRFPRVRIRGRSPEGESHHEDSCGDGDAEDAYLHGRSVSARPAKKLAVQRASRLDTKNTSNVHPKPVRLHKESLARHFPRTLKHRVGQRTGSAHLSAKPHTRHTLPIQVVTRQRVNPAHSSAQLAGTDSATVPGTEDKECPWMQSHQLPL